MELEGKCTKDAPRFSLLMCIIEGLPGSSGEVLT
jgi:hypothetical protein